MLKWIRGLHITEDVEWNWFHWRFWLAKISWLKSWPPPQFKAFCIWFFNRWKPLLWFWVFNDVTISLLQRLWLPTVVILGILCFTDYSIWHLLPHKHYIICRCWKHFCILPSPFLPFHLTSLEISTTLIILNPWNRFQSFNNKLRLFLLYQSLMTWRCCISITKFNQLNEKLSNDNSHINQDVDV